MKHFALSLLASAILTAQTAGAASLSIESQGSFAAGGTVIAATADYDHYHPAAAGQTLHGDHAHVSYQIPENASGYPLVFLHGAGQFSKTWDTTPDNREGFRTRFLRRNFRIMRHICGLTNKKKYALEAFGHRRTAKSKPRLMKASGSDSSAWACGRNSIKGASFLKTKSRSTSSSAR